MLSDLVLWAHQRGAWLLCAHPLAPRPKNFLQVVPVPPAYLYAHHQLLEEFRNASHWPKHLIIQYSFQLAPSEDALSALYVTFALCAPPTASLRMQSRVCMEVPTLQQHAHILHASAH